MTWQTSNQELGLCHATVRRCVMSLCVTWTVGLHLLKVSSSLRLTSGSPTVEEGFWTWSWRLSGLNWELKRITISWQGIALLASDHCCYLVIFQEWVSPSLQLHHCLNTLVIKYEVFILPISILNISPPYASASKPCSIFLLVISMPTFLRL